VKKIEKILKKGLQLRLIYGIIIVSKDKNKILKGGNSQWQEQERQTRLIM
jgi:hypothetical protein